MRGWNEFVAAVADITGAGVPMLAFLTFLLAVITSLALYFWPHWLPWRWRFRGGAGRRGRRGRDGDGRRHRFRLGALRFRWHLRWRRRRRGAREALDDLAPDELPDLPADVLSLTADQLAAAGRYAEAVRERLRAMVRELIEREVIPHTPGWTVTELAAAASIARPALSPPLRDAAEVFSQIWYGMRPAVLADDNAMRAHAGAVRNVLAEPVAIAGGVG